MDGHLAVAPGAGVVGASDGLLFSSAGPKQSRAFRLKVLRRYRVTPTVSGVGNLSFH